MLDKGLCTWSILTNDLFYRKICINKVQYARQESKYKYERVAYRGTFRSSSPRPAFSFVLFCIALTI